MPILLSRTMRQAFRNSNNNPTKNRKYFLPNSTVDFIELRTSISDRAKENGITESVLINILHEKVGQS
jgi:hypothetical protein